MKLLLILLTMVQLYAEPVLCLLYIEKVQLSADGIVKSLEPKEIRKLYLDYYNDLRGVQYECPEDSQLVQSTLDTENYINEIIKLKVVK